MGLIMNIQQLIELIDQLSSEASAEAVDLREWATHVPGRSECGVCRGHIMAYRKRDGMMHSAYKLNDHEMAWLCMMGVDKLNMEIHI